MKNYDIVIVGGGASGMIATINAARTNNKLKICILEHLPKIGKKILATGNGRCNITNSNANCNDYNNSDFVKYALNKYSSDKVIEFFETIGLKCTEDSEGRAYPISNNSSTVLDCLRSELEFLKIEIITEYEVTSIKKSSGYFIINNEITAKKILISTGGKSSPSQGSDGTGYQILKSFNHSIITPYPALVQLKTEENLKSLKGIRVKSKVTLYQNKKIINTSKGEVLFTDYGLSGIAIMDISRSVKNNTYLCELEILPELSSDDIKNFILLCKNHNPNNTVVNVLSGILPRSLSKYILKQAGINSEIIINRIHNEEISIIIKKIKSLRFSINGTNGFNNAQITAGGANVDEFNEVTMESKLVKGLYCSGELLDIDAPCGGFNLQWAWASGLLAGENIAKN